MQKVKPINWNLLNLRFDILDYRDADNWDKGNVDAPSVNWDRVFKDKDYRRERQALVDVMKAFSVANSLVPAAHCRLLRQKWRKPLRDVVLDIVLCFNRYGRVYTAWHYRFARNHKFDWLPKTGVRASTGLVWNKQAGKLVYWKPAYCPRDWCLYRELRGFPDDILNVNVASAGSVQPARKDRQLLFNNFEEGMEELNAMIEAARKQQ